MTNNDWNNSILSGLTSFNNGLTISSAGIDVNGAQPAFLNKALFQLNFTGGSPSVFKTVPFASTSYFNVGNSWASPSFTVPKDGIYFFHASVTLSGLTGGTPLTSAGIRLLASTTGASSNSINHLGKLKTVGMPSIDGKYCVIYNSIMKLIAGETVQLQLYVKNSSGSRYVSISSDTQHYFGGYLIC